MKRLEVIEQALEDLSKIACDAKFSQQCSVCSVVDALIRLRRDDIELIDRMRALNLELQDLRLWQEKSFEVHPNLDLDIEAYDTRRTSS